MSKRGHRDSIGKHGAGKPKGRLPMPDHLVPKLVPADAPQPDKVGPDTPGWKLQHVDPTNAHGHAYDYFACPRCGGLFIVPIEHECPSSGPPYYIGASYKPGHSSDFPF